jgi:hypothetical protein
LSANLQQAVSLKSALAPLLSDPRIFSATPPRPPKFGGNFSSQTLCSFSRFQVTAYHSARSPSQYTTH